MAAGEAGATHNRVIREDPSPTSQPAPEGTRFANMDGPGAEQVGVLYSLPTTHLSSSPSFSSLLRESHEGKSLSGGKAY